MAIGLLPALYAHLAMFYCQPRSVWLSFRYWSLSFALGGIHASHVSVAVKCCSDFPKLQCFFMLCHFTLSICLCSCPIQHVPAESVRSAGEIRRLELFLPPKLFPL